MYSKPLSPPAIRTLRLSRTTQLFGCSLCSRHPKCRVAKSGLALVCFTTSAHPLCRVTVPFRKVGKESPAIPWENRVGSLERGGRQSLSSVKTPSPPNLLKLEFGQGDTSVANYPGRCSPNTTPIHSQSPQRLCVVPRSFRGGCGGLQLQGFSLPIPPPSGRN